MSDVTAAIALALLLLAQAGSATVRSLSVAVSDEKGALVEGLTRDEVVVLENGVARELTLLEPDRRPLTLALVVDSSQPVSTAFRLQLVPAITEFLLGFVELGETEAEPRPEEVQVVDRLIETAAERLHPSLTRDDQLRSSLAEHLHRLEVARALLGPFEAGAERAHDPLEGGGRLVGFEVLALEVDAASAPHVGEEAVDARRGEVDHARGDYEHVGPRGEGGPVEELLADDARVEARARGDLHPDLVHVVGAHERRALDHQRPPARLGQGAERRQEERRGRDGRGDDGGWPAGGHDPFFYARRRPEVQRLRAGYR